MLKVLHNLHMHKELATLECICTSAVEFLHCYVRALKSSRSRYSLHTTRSTVMYLPSKITGRKR